MAAEFSAPSFSLGLDLDFEEDDDDHVHHPQQQQDREREEEEEDLELVRENLERDPQRPAFKRLRRGPPPPPPAAAAGEGNEGLEEEEEIENYSSQEEGDRLRDSDISLQSLPTCSSSKVSLHYHGVLSSQSVKKLKTPQSSSTYNASASSNFQASSNRISFPWLNVSPLRKIHLIDSDSDDDRFLYKENMKSKEVDASDKKKKFQSHEHQESFWKDFGVKESNILATPALDEFCEEYFNSTKNKRVRHHEEEDQVFCSSKVADPDVEDFFRGSSSSRKPDHSWDFPHPQPPAYQYFYHEDARVRNLIRERLPYFVPIGADNHKGTHQFGTDTLDYMGQFTHGDGPSQARGSQKKASVRTSKTRGKRPTTNSEEASQVTGSWVNPRNTTSIPKDAGKRRVSAVSRQSGHWFTGQNGKKVYISKNGQELTGQIAYKQYRKESGSGIRRGKKKAATRKKKK